MTMSFRMQAGDKDRRYRMRVFLVSNERKYRKFYCGNCGVNVCEIEDSIIYMSDVADASPVPKVTGVIAVECPGRFCRTWYEFITRPGG